MKFYTRYDVQNLLLSRYYQWDERWMGVEVYPEELIITVKEHVADDRINHLLQNLSEWFGQRYDPGSRELLLDYPGYKMKVIVEVDEFASRPSRMIPLFESLYQPVLDEKTIPVELPGVPVYAFHSFKGGVGRTLVLLAITRSLSKLRKDEGKPYQLLLVDGDLEAPGLTWLADGGDFERSFFGTYDISYLDALTLVYEAEGRNDKVLQFIAEKIQEYVLRFPVGEQEVEHYFLPAFRDVTQLMAMPITPSHLVKMSGHSWIMGDFLSQLGRILNVDAVLVDLRAGISEFAAPLLFDPRIQKFYVTSTSLQSVRGMELLLRKIYQKPLGEDNPRPIVVINQVSDELSKEKRQRITECLLDAYPGKEDENLLDQVAALENIVYLPFASNLIHLEGLKTIDVKLNNTGMAQVIDRIVSERLFPQIRETTSFPESRETFLQKLEDFAQRMEFAEKNPVTDFLRTTSLKNLARKYRQQIPSAVIMGAKGSGKTFAYMQLMRCETWEKFVHETLKTDQLPAASTCIMPFLRPRNMDDYAIKEVDKRLEHLSEEVGFQCPSNFFASLLEEVQKKLAQPETGLEAHTLNSEYHWKSFWKRCLLESAGLPFEKLDDLQEHLQKLNKRVVFVIDGLEDIFQKFSSQERERVAIRALIQGLVNEFRENPKSHLGLLIFIRRDLAMYAIEQNWGQFASLYMDYELHWDHEEALRLVNWIACQVDHRFAKEFMRNGVEIEKASQERLEKNLYPLWGIKLGKPDSREAYTANWVLAALSDLNEQLQARDVVRFLKYAAKYSLEQKGTYSDRYLVPTAIRRAIDPCSEDKISDLKKEMVEIERIFDILTRDKEKRQIPFKAEDYDLTTREIKLLEEQGFLLETDDGYYMPEIIRRGLGFQIQAGARPKVLALLRAAKRKR